MGLQIGELVPRKQIAIESLKGKVIAVDAFNTLYQFLSNIRQADGTPLMDSKGRITSHLSGLFYRNTNLMSKGLKIVYVFDGKSPDLKKDTNKGREERKKDAESKFETAKKEGKEEDMFKYSRQTVHLTDEIIQESKDLLKALGIPIVQSPSEGESQASYIAKHDGFAVASQDYDSLLFGAPKLIQNLALSKKRRLSSGAYVPIEPEIIELENVFNTLQIDHDQLICLGILSGTDFNPGGIRGIGPKKALTFVQKYKHPVLIFEAVEKQLLKEGKEIWFNWQEIFELFKKPNIIKEYKLEFHDIDESKVKDILCKEHDFSEDRVSNSLNKIREAKELGKQKDLKNWF